MAEFTTDEWRKIGRLFDTDAERFGLPQRRKESVLLASFNVCKLGGLRDDKGKPKRPREAWRFLGEICSRFDLIGWQEVMDDLEGIRFLRDLAGVDEYGLAVSDVTGGVPYGRGMRERLGFLFRWESVRRTDLAADISYDRTAIVGNLLENADDFAKVFTSRAREIIAAHNAALIEWQKGGQRGREPKKKSIKFHIPHFLSFIRTPYCASFEIAGFGDAEPYKILAVNAHLLFGDTKIKAKERLTERENEFNALIKWLMWRMAHEKAYYHQMVLLGDLNLDFKESDDRRVEIKEKIKSLDKKLNSKSGSVYFPFIDEHPPINKSVRSNVRGKGLVFRTNARDGQTFDHIAFFGHDPRMPNHAHTQSAGQTPNSFDYGVFNFADLAAEALYGRNRDNLTKLERKALFTKLKHDVSDHMPIWVRLPRPYPGQKGPFIE